MMTKDTFALEFKNKFAIEKININSAQRDICAFSNGNKLYFSSNRRENAKIPYANADSVNDYYNIFVSEKSDPINFKNPENLKKFNTTYCDGPIFIDLKQTIALITCNERKYDFIVEDPRQKQKLKIYYSINQDEKWTSIKIHPVCTGPYSYCHAILCNENKTIIFSSDMPGGYGGMDLYFSNLKNNAWSIPKNMGAKINSSYDEVFPTICNGILYYSSNKPGAIGGLDLYSTRIKDSARTKPKLLELPINSQYDDYGISSDSLGISGYLTSNRSDRTNDDIYYYYSIIPPLQKKALPKNKYCYTFFEESTLKSSDTAGMSYEWHFGKASKQMGIKTTHCFNKPGKYPIQLNIIDRSSGKSFINQLNYDFVVKDEKQLKIISPDTIKCGSPLILDASPSTLEGYTIKKYYWIFNDGWYNMGIRVRHKYLSDGKYILKLGVLAVNDSTKKEEMFYTEKTIYVYQYVVIF